MSTRVRFAPSPTGHLHMGNVRTALFNYLFARNMRGTLILRIEDTDFERSTKESENLIYEDLKWIGIKWDEGPYIDDKSGKICINGNFGPYRQTERLHIHKKYVEQLLSKGKAYKCFCTKKRLEDMKKKAISNGRPPRYDRTCLNLSDNEIKAREDEGIKPSIRYKVDKDTVKIDDLIKGSITFNTNSFGDFIIVRPDGKPVYNFVVVIDDALMKITHVIRGDDHLSNTPKQVLIYESLGFNIPLFAHIPMILGPDHTKLSKRHGDMSLDTFKKTGYLPEALLNYLSLLGWSDEKEREILTKEELIASFSLDRVSKSAAIFDVDKTKWFNGLYIRKLETDVLTQLCIPYLMSTGLIDNNYIESSYTKLKEMIASIADNLQLLSHISEYIKVYFEFDDSALDEEAHKMLQLGTSKHVLSYFLEELEGKEEISIDEYKKMVQHVKERSHVKGKALYMVIRIGVTGKMTGPELEKLVTIIPVPELKRRVSIIIKNILED